MTVIDAKLGSLEISAEEVARQLFDVFTDPSVEAMTDAMVGTVGSALDRHEHAAAEIAARFIVMAKKSGAGWHDIYAFFGVINFDIHWADA